MSKELSSAEKSRRTKLGNKSVEELIDIIIRKDDVGRRKDNLIKALKINIQGLEKKNESLNNDIKNAETQINELHEAIKKTSNSAIKMFALGGVIGILIMTIVAHIF